MQCLHGKAAASSTTENGDFWFCAQNPKCEFLCSEEDGLLYDRAIQAFLATNQVLPKCCVLEDPDDDQECNFAKIYVVKDPLKENYGRPFFKCSKKDGERCNYFEWGDEPIIEKPLYKHGKRCKLWKVKKEGPNHGRSFFKCPELYEESCKFFKWIKTPPTPSPPTSPSPTPSPSPKKLLTSSLWGKMPVGINAEENNETRSIYIPNYYTDYSNTTPLPIPKRKKCK